MGTKRYKRDFRALEQRRHKAAKLLSRGGSRRKPLGHRAALGTAERKRLCKLLLKGAVTNGFATELWTLQRIADLIKREFGVAHGKTYVWLLLKALGFSCQRPTGRARQRDEQAILEWKNKRWPMLKKARREGRTILFIDETGLSERPTRVKRWAPRPRRRYCDTASTGRI